MKMFINVVGHTRGGRSEDTNEQGGKLLMESEPGSWGFPIFFTGQEQLWVLREGWEGRQRKTCVCVTHFPMMWEARSSENEWGGRLCCGLNQEGGVLEESPHRSYIQKGWLNGVKLRKQACWQPPSVGFYDGLWEFGAEEAFRLGWRESVRGVDEERVPLTAWAVWRGEATRR